MSKLLDKLKSSGSLKVDTIAKSEFFARTKMYDTKVPIINLAFSGDVDGGFNSGLTILAGASKSFKTMLGLKCMKTYLDENKDAVALFYDSEFGTPPSYLTRFGIDVDRVLHIPIEHVEQLKFDMVKRLEEVERGDKVFIFLDSLGNLASKKEVEDANNEKSVTDMTRAKAIRSLFRIVTPNLATKDIPCFVINHVYQSMDFIPRNVIPGGTGVMYSANSVFVISKAQEKEGKDIVGYKFTITIEKSRFVREKAKLPFTVTYEKGIHKYSGILDLACELNFVAKPSMGWYQLVNTETGEMVGDKVRAKDTDSDSFLGKVVQNPKFKEAVARKYKLEYASVGDEDETVTEETLND